MKLDPKFKPELCASKDGGSWNLSAPYFDKEKGVVVATSGHHLVVVPAQVEDGDEAQHLPPEDLERARQGDQPPAQEPNRQRGKYPDWKQVVPSFKPFDPDTVCVGLNAAYLLEIAQAMGSRHHKVILTFDPKSVTSWSPILVTPTERFGPGDAYGVLMTVRLYDPRPEPAEKPTPAMLAQAAEEESKRIEEAERAAELLVLEARKAEHLRWAAQLEDEIEALQAPPATEKSGEVSGG